MNINGQEIVKGFNINDKEQPFTKQILNMIKSIETRDTNSLDSLIGHRVALIRTGCGKAMIVGIADIVGCIEWLTESAFRADEHLHQVKAGSKYDISNSKYGKKYGYILKNVERCDPILAPAGGHVIRNI